MCICVCVPVHLHGCSRMAEMGNLLKTAIYFLQLWRLVSPRLKGRQSFYQECSLRGPPHSYARDTGPPVWAEPSRPSHLPKAPTISMLPGGSVSST